MLNHLLVFAVRTPDKRLTAPSVNLDFHAECFSVSSFVSSFVFLFVFCLLPCLSVGREINLRRVGGGYLEQHRARSGPEQPPLLKPRLRRSSASYPLRRGPGTNTCFFSIIMMIWMGCCDPSCTM